MNGYQEKIEAYLDEHLEEFSTCAKKIHEFAEPSSEEYQSAALLCDLLEETQAKDRLPLAEVKPLKKPSLRQQLNTALKEARQHPPKDDKTHGGDVR